MHFAQAWQRDLFEQSLFDLGCDTLDDDDAYIPTEQWEHSEAQIRDLCARTEGVTFVRAERCPDENWNATWEAEHPIYELPMGVRIMPHCAFGAGYHETTSMMIEALLHADIKDQEVLDHGTGTGVLAIMAKRQGARRVVAVDIDEKSVSNAQENAALNDEEIEVLQGATPPEGMFDLILANIHRNVLLQCMSAYSAHMRAGGQLWMSGFYESDIACLQSAAEAQGMIVMDVLANGEWRLMRCQKAVH